MTASFFFCLSVMVDFFVSVYILFARILAIR